MALGKLSPFTKLLDKRPDEIVGTPAPSGAPGLGGEPSSGGNILASIQRASAPGQGGSQGPTPGQRATQITEALAKLGVKNFGGKGVNALIDYFRGGAPQGMDILNSMAGAGELGLGAGSLDTTLPTLLPDTTLGNTPEFSGLLQDLQGSLVSPNLVDPTLNLGSEAGSVASGAAGGIGGSGITTGGIGAGAGAVAAILGLIAQQTGNKELAQAASALGAAAGVGTTGASIAAAASPAVASALGMSAASAGLGAAGGVAAAPFLIASIWHMIDPENSPDIMDMFGAGSDNPDPYYKFAKKLGQNESQQGRAFQMLQQALPYARSKEELGQLINTYNNYLATTQDAPVTMGPGGGTSPGKGIPFNYAGMNPYEIGYIPGATGFEHGGGATGRTGPSADWGPISTTLQNLTNYLKTSLPGTELGMGYTGLTGEAATRLWNQFTDRTQTAPKYSPTGWAGTTVGGESVGQGETPVINIPGFEKGVVSGVSPDTSYYAPPGSLLSYGEPGYDYAAAGLPEPGQYFGTQSDAFKALQAAPQTPQGFATLGTNSSATAPAGPGQAGGQKSNLQGTLGFAGLTGPLNEIRGGDNPNQI